MGVETKNNKSSEDSHNETKVSYFHIFKYGKIEELMATVIGFTLGLLSSGGVCYNMVQFGELSTAFVERTSQQDRLSSRLPLLSLFGGGRRLVNASHEENMEALMKDGIAMTIGLFISIAISVTLTMTSVALINWSALRQMTRIRTLFLNSVLRQDMAWFDTDSEFNLASKMSENMMKLKDGMGEKLSIVSNLYGTAILCLCQAFPLGWQLTLACMAVLPFSLSAAIMLSKYQTKSSIKEMESYSQAGKQAEEVLKSIKTVIAFAGERKETERYGKLLEPAEAYGRKRGLYTGIGTGFNWVLTYSLNAIGLSYGTRLLLADFDKPDDERNYVVGVVFSVMFSVYMATQSITLSVPHMEMFASARGAATSIFGLLDRKPDIDSMKQTGLSPKRVIGEISLEDVHFSYPSRANVKVLQGFSLSVKPGEHVALVGSSGCGKSTILQLLQRLYDPQLGTVRLDGKNLKNLNLNWLRSCLGVVGQEPVLFHRTIHENIAIGYPDASREDVQKAAMIAYAHKFIMHLPDGYDTVIGERGASLSGGQKQRIAIARSLLRDPAILLFDEATSALDPHSEREVQAALDRASIGRTTLTVSHRLSTIFNADRIICMDQGVIVEQGTYEELLKFKGFFYKLVTTSKENKEMDLIDSLPEEDSAEKLNQESNIITRNDIKRKSNRKLQRQRSSIRESNDFVSRRGSLLSTTSLAEIQSFPFRYESQEKLDEEEDIQPVSDWQLLKLNAPEWPYLVLGSTAAFLQGCCFPAFSVLFGYTVGIFATPDHSKMLYNADLYSGMFIVIAAVAGLSMCLQGFAFTNAGLRMTTRLRQQYFSALLNQEMAFFDKESNTVGAMCARLSGDAAEVQGATGLRIGLIIQGVSSLGVGCIMAFCYNWKLTLVGIAFLPLMVGSIWMEGIMSQKSQTNERAAMESATAVATEAIVSIKTVQSLGVEQSFLDKFIESLRESCAAIAKKTRWRGLVLGLGAYVPFLSFCSATAYGTYLVAYEGINFQVVFLVNQSIMYGAYMLGHSLVHAPSFNSAKSCGARIIAIIKREPKIITQPGLKDKKNWVATGSFHVQNVEFCYPTRPDQKILRGMNLKVEAGKTVALVGASGCGKSTILQLMQRFYDPDTGSISLDGHDTRKSLTLPRLRRQLGVVQQEPVLFDRTIAENIAYGDNSRKVSMQEIIAAAKAANIHSFIVSLPQGYNTNLGASGAQLSGGQKQRVCIARALIRSPRLLLLDEATSALDANSEMVVSEALEKAAKGRTCITIAHRLSTIKDADLICVVDKGKIIESGTHAELINLQGYYWMMCKGQLMA